MASHCTLVLAAAVALPTWGARAFEGPDVPLRAPEQAPLPKKVKHVQPVYPPEALAQGIRGIVILDVVVDTKGDVTSVSVIRSVPGLDEAAIAAATQWKYEPVRVDGKPVEVVYSIPLTFSLALPQLVRQTDIPELRQGVSPSWPQGATGGGLVTAEVTLEPDGRVGVAQVLEGGAPWSTALLAALKTWRFSPPPEEEVLSFRVEAEFVAARGSDSPKVYLKATGLQRSGLLAEPAPPPKPATPAEGPPTGAPPVATPAVSNPPVETPSVAAPTPAVEAVQAPPAPASPASPTGPPSAAPPGAPPAATPPATPAPADPPPQATPSTTTPPAAAAPPPVEVLTAPPPPLPPESGVSAIRDVTLELGVPDLTRGRRPVSPPLARMSGTTGTVEVSFSVSAAGTTSLQASTGPELLRPAAEQTVSSWVFRRARADRAYLVAVFTYAGDKSAAVVRPQPPAAGGTAPATTPPGPPGS